MLSKEDAKYIHSEIKSIWYYCEVIKTLTQELNDLNYIMTKPSGSGGYTKVKIPVKRWDIKKKRYIIRIEEINYSPPKNKYSVGPNYLALIEAEEEKMKKLAYMKTALNQANGYLEDLFEMCEDAEHEFIKDYFDDKVTNTMLVMKGYSHPYKHMISLIRNNVKCV